MFHVVIKGCSQDSGTGETAKIIRSKSWECRDLSKGIPVWLPDGTLLAVATLDRPWALASLCLQFLKGTS